MERQGAAATDLVDRLRLQLPETVPRLSPLAEAPFSMKERLLLDHRILARLRFLLPAVWCAETLPED